MERGPRVRNSRPSRCCFSINLPADNIIKGPGEAAAAAAVDGRTRGDDSAAVAAADEEIFFIMRSVKIAALVPVKPFV